MSNKPSFRRYTPKSRIVSRQKKDFVDRFAGWLGSRSRLARSMIAAIVALILTGALVLVSYGLLLSISSNSILGAMDDHPEILTIIFVILVIIGLALYWFGWRLLIGFDRGEKVLEPGRSAAIWVLLGFSVLLVVLFFAALSVADALSS